MSKSPNLSRVAFVLLAVVPATTFAQDRSALLLKVPTEGQRALGGPTGRAQPGVSSASPLGFGPAWRDIFGGIGYQAKTRYGGQQDGSVSIGIGVGNPNTMLGVELVLTSLSTVRSGFGERMVGGVKLHRAIPGNAAIGVGVEGFKITGKNIETKESYYVALSKVANLMSGDYLSTIMLNAGVGNGRFQSEDDVIAGKNNMNVFASVGLRLAPAFGAIADWTGQDLNLALSIAPLPKVGFVITPGFADVTQNAGDGARFTLGAGLSVRF